MKRWQQVVALFASADDRRIGWIGWIGWDAEDASDLLL
jgi:hypothetical protein